ncbi:ABC transporter ATP-binding protein [Corynebacterium silvaticum]|uniref:ABC transporter ATP-binding protein n=1 Tax=Corynebacterium silvaticum TaxID=2320431 RepID=A0A7U5HL26_9CORY|nr:ABC transporter ATP-binding protein [Corynebacterium silvaticum]ARU45752.1 ABC transporter ATP-binding protein [Corynebacterium silvaticum]UWH00869.1 ABC transporter ATP-binding protein [Corynebacterium silvaticum]UWH02916.1 ABC transporter ATP-binding protein [Corynebacterium silvaticum]UWH04956.1 ABC transporter ATP-binding protein [Corynebacterium silvaticum]UXZ27115.1 ABC transporter ATP-binding protein [Corynebacterium silvaticum]
MDLAVATRDLSKSFGKHRVLNSINLQVPKGSCYGFVGENGAGKTTTLRILAGLAAASSGSATVLGAERGKLPVKPVPGVSYLPDVPQISPWLGAKDALITLARLSGITPDLAAERSGELLNLVNLDRAPGRVGSFSRGMKQRLGIAAALIGAPKLLLIDEPTSALDPIGRADVLALLRELTGDVTIIFSSHILTDVANVSTHVGILHRGNLLAQGPLEELLAQQTKHVTLNVTVRSDLATAVTDAICALDAQAQIRPTLTGLDELFTKLTKEGGK